jgi:hypothetical protein
MQFFDELLENLPADKVQVQVEWSKNWANNFLQHPFPALHQSGNFITFMQVFLKSH